MKTVEATGMARKEWRKPGRKAALTRVSAHLPGSSIRHGRGRRRAFTFVELLAAMVFMAIVIPVSIEGVLLANRVGITAERRREAAQLADRMLSQIVVTEAWRDGDQTGDFGDDWPECSWELTCESWTEDIMGLLTLRVYYYVQDREYAVELSTLVDVSEEETGEEAAS